MNWMTTAKKRVCGRKKGIAGAIGQQQQLQQQLQRGGTVKSRIERDIKHRNMDMTSKTLPGNIGANSMNAISMTGSSSAPAAKDSNFVSRDVLQLEMALKYNNINKSMQQQQQQEFNQRPPPIVTLKESASTKIDPLDQLQLSQPESDTTVEEQSLLYFNNGKLCEESGVIKEERTSSFLDNKFLPR